MIVTPATRFGSWHWLERVIESLPQLRWTVVSYGKPDHPVPNTEFVNLAATDYRTIGQVAARRGLTALNLLYYLPLTPLIWWSALTRRPRTLIGNGLVATALLWPIALLLRCKLFLAYHGYSGHLGRTWQTVMRWFLPKCDGVFVNSKTSCDDLARFVGRDRIVTIDLWASELFFSCPLERDHDGPLRILFVGRLDNEKFAQCLRVGKKLANAGTAELWAVGDGPLAGELQQGGGLRWLGYVADQDRLAEIYAQADLVWAPADTTYVSLPGVEGLASGCPLVIGDIPAVEVRANAGHRIPRNLLPGDVAHVVDGTDDSEAVSIITSYARSGVALSQRDSARAYARRHHSQQNIAPLLAAIR